jgi:hypothetical protein
MLSVWDSGLQKAAEIEANTAGIRKRAGCHNLRDS